jgi:proline dehydrogenase
MQAPLPGPRTQHTPAHYGFDVPVLLRRFVAGPRADDAVRVAGELAAEGRLVALEPVPGRGDDVAGELAVLAALIRTAGLVDACELTLPVDRLSPEEVTGLAGAGPAVVLSGAAAAVDALAAGLPEAGVVVPAGEPGAEDRCRELGGRHVRLADGRGADADLAFVRCLNVLMAAGGRPAVATCDLRLIAIAGERAAWNGRAPDSWEHVMPYGVRTTEQRRLTAAGLTVRVAVPSGRGAVPALARALVGRA